MRPPGSGTKITKGNKTYYRVRITITDEFGRTKEKGFERATLAQAQNAARVYEAKHGRVFIATPGGTVKELFELVDIAVWSQSGEKNRLNMGIYRRAWEKLIGNSEVESLTTPDLTRALHAICAKKSRSFIVKAARAMRQALDYAVSDLGWITRNPADDMRFPKPDGKKLTYPPMDRAEYERMLSLAEPRYALLIRLIGECGMRPIEAVRVRPEHLLTVHDRWLVHIPKSKTPAGVRSVPVSDELAKLIESHAGKDWEGIADRAESLRRWWRANSKTRLYDLRGWRADEWRRMGIPDQLRSWLMGHTNPHFTQHVYEELTHEDTLKMFP